MYVMRHHCHSWQINWELSTMACAGAARYLDDLPETQLLRAGVCRPYTDLCVSVTWSLAVRRRGRRRAWGLDVHLLWEEGPEDWGHIYPAREDWCFGGSVCTPIYFLFYIPVYWLISLYLFYAIAIIRSPFSFPRFRIKCSFDLTTQGDQIRIK